MSKLSCSFTLGKVSAGKANIEHNNREFISSNVDPTRIANNIVYVREDVQEVYNELFNEALEQYNANQKRNDRKIHDYYKHISQGSREEAYYEVIVQFGDADTAGIGTPDGKFAVELLDEYVRNFEKRNPNLRVFSSIIHLDETSPHAHINFVPFYTEQKKIGMSKGVSLKSALIEQGFVPQGIKQHQLVLWEQSEMAVMENILNGRGIERDVKNATHAHKSVPEFKASQDWRKLPKRKKKLTTLECYENDLRTTREENSLLKVENDKLLTEKHSDWKCFYFSDPDKHRYVQNRLIELGIPFRESDTGFDAQQCHVERIRQIEKQYKANPTSHRDILRERLDKIAMQVNTYDEIIEELKRYGYEVKHGKYLAVRPKDGDRFIRIKSLGEFYNEQAIRNRIDNRHHYENQLENTLNSLVAGGKAESLEYRGQITIKQYIVSFKQNLLPARKKKKQFVFSWKNDEQLDKLATLNRKINEGVSIKSLQGELADSERNILQMESRIERLRNNPGFDKNLFDVAERWYDSPPYKRNQDDVYILERHEYTSDKYYNHKQIITDNDKIIADIEKSFSNERDKIKSTTEILNDFEKIASLTYVDFLVNLEAERRQAERIGNGVKPADSSTEVKERVGAVAEKVVKAVEQKIVEPPPQTPRTFKRK